ncbi:MAG: transcription initiation factor IIB [Candidatus Hydrothermarchaeales archaeon]
MEVEYTIACPECGSKSLTKDYERAEIICNDCGRVVDEDIIDYGPEWRAFDSEQMSKRSRTGAPMNYLVHDKGLSTTIDWRNQDFSGRPIASRKMAQLYRIRKWQQRVRISNAKERNLAIALVELSKLSSKLNLSKNVREASSMVYRKALAKGLIRGRSIEAVATACIYAACRQCKVPRTLDEVAEASLMSRKEIGKAYRYISRELSFNLNPTTPIDYIPRFCSELNLNTDVQRRAVEISEKAMDKELTSGRGPTGVSAAAIYIASVLMGERRTQKEVADVAGVTEVTIRNRYKEIAETLEIELVLS